MSLEVSIYVNRVPAPLLSEMVTEVTVEQVGNGTSRYRVSFETDIARGDYQIVNHPRLQPSFLGFDNELAIVLRDGVLYKCLINGPIEERHFEGRTGGPGSVLVVTGSDRTAVMDRIDQQRMWAGTESMAVLAILGTAYHFEPDVEETTLLYDPLTRPLVQAHSDLDFVRDCACRNGFNFWVTTEIRPGAGSPGAALVDVAHFRTAPPRARPTALPLPPQSPQTTVPILRLNAATESIPGLRTTTNQLESRTNTEAPYVVTGFRIDEITGAVVAITQPQLPANSVPFGIAPIQVVGGPRFPPPTLQFSSAGGVLDAYVRAEAAITDAAHFVRGRLETTREAAGALIVPNTFARVQGTGGINQGQYWVDAVTHTIDSNCHRMSIQLRRNAQGVAI